MVDSYRDGRTSDRRRGFATLAEVEAALRAVQDQIDDLWGPVAFDASDLRFQTRAALAAAVVAKDGVPVRSVAVDGYARPGDHGRALYRRVEVEPPHAGKVRSQDGVWWELAEARLHAEMLGAVPDDFAGDLSATLADAVEAAHEQKSGHLFLGPGKFRGNLVLAHGAGRPISLEGTYNGTVLRAAADGDWAVRLPATTFTERPYFSPRLAEFAIDGHGSDGVSRRRCGLFAPRRFDGSHISITDCLIGYLRTANFYGGIQFMHVLGCDVGMWIGTFDNSSLRLTGLRDANGEPRSTLLPEAPRSETVHSGNVRYSDGTARGSRFGVVIGGESEGTNPMIEFENYTVEANQVGMVVSAGDVTLDKVWFESNGSGGTETLNGHAYPHADLVVDGRYGRANQAAREIATARLSRCRIRRVVIGDNAIVIYDDDTQVLAAPEIVGGGSAMFNRIQMDNLFLPHVVARPRPRFGSELPGRAASGRGCASYAHPKHSRIWTVQPRGGRILVSDDMTGTGFRSRRLGIAGSPTVGWPTGAGLFEARRCLRLTHDADHQGLSADFSNLVSDGHFYVLLIAMRPDEEVAVGFGNGWQRPPDLKLPGGEWNTLAVVAPLDRATVAGPTVIRVFAGSAGYPLDVLYGGIQIAGFAGAGDAADFCAGNAFYMTEA